MRDNGPKDRKFTFNESGDEIAYTVLLRRYNALNLSDQTHEAEVYPVSKCLNNFKNTAGRSETRRGVGPLKQHTKSFSSHWDLICPDLYMRSRRAVCNYTAPTEGNYFGFEISPLYTQIHSLGDKRDPCSINSEISVYLFTISCTTLPVC